MTTHKGLTLTQADKIGHLMEQVNTAPQETQHFAISHLLYIKQDMIDSEDYEAARDFRKLELMHSLDLPFKIGS